MSRHRNVHYTLFDRDEISTEILAEINFLCYADFVDGNVQCDGVFILVDCLCNFDKIMIFEDFSNLIRLTLAMFALI